LSHPVSEKRSKITNTPKLLENCRHKRWNDLPVMVIAICLLNNFAIVSLLRKNKEEPVMNRALLIVLARARNPREEACEPRTFWFVYALLA
jgi:hypothetical protein